MNDFVSVIGCDSSSAEVASFVAMIGGRPEVETIEDRSYWELKKAGIALVFNSESKLVALQFYRGGRDGYSEYKGILPDNLVFNDDRSAVHSRIGEPTKSGGGQVVPVIGGVSPWDLFERENHSLHIEYSDTGISLVSLLLL